jgi:hypothetical protein
MLREARIASLEAQRAERRAEKAWSSRPLDSVEALSSGGGWRIVIEAEGPSASRRVSMRRRREERREEAD